MDEVNGKLQVFFEDPFWVGIFESVYGGELSVCRIVFGPEPKENEIQEFVLRNYYKLKFSPAIKCAVKNKENINPKRLQREIKKQVKEVRVGTKSQQALKLQNEESKIERKIKTREQKEQEERYKFQLKQQKRKEKHKGR
ncbi:MAG: DUF2992 family protein [Clostridium butyricum]|nr:DUF2992 family protein [Clostridium butyricum]